MSFGAAMVEVDNGRGPNFSHQGKARTNVLRTAIPIIKWIPHSIIINKANHSLTVVQELLFL